MKIKKVLTLIVCLVVCISFTFSATGCRADQNQLPSGTSENTILTISNYGAGFGSSWLYKAKARFEKKYAETSFEEGKKGVFIDIQNTLSSGMGWVNQISGRTEDIFFTEQVYYPDAVANKYFLDVTDIVTENMTLSQGENKTIESKLSQEQKDYYKIDGKYYGLPHYSGYFGIVYDIDLFQQRNLYFNHERTGLIKNSSEKKSVGLDGLPETDDDGLPMTYAEMFTLCKAMRNRGITPFIWSGKSRDVYMGAFINSLYADYEGLSNFMLNFRLQGVASNLADSVTVDQEGIITSVGNLHSEEINLSTGYKVYKQVGRAYALSFVEQIIKGFYFAEECRDESFSNSEAQRAFLESRPYGQNPIAMLIDGNFWDVEASAAFREIENDYPGEQWKRENRKFGFMPFPKATEEQIDDGLTLFDYLYSCAFINARIPVSKIKAAKSFLQFLYTDESLVEFTVTTNTSKALNYEMSDTETASISKFGQTVWAMKKNADIAYPFADNNVYLYSQSDFNMLYNWKSLVGGEVKTSMIDAVRKDGLSAATLFGGFSDYYTESRWNSLYGEHF